MLVEINFFPTKLKTYVIQQRSYSKTIKSSYLRDKAQVICNVQLLVEMKVKNIVSKAAEGAKKKKGFFWVERQTDFCSNPGYATYLLLNARVLI